VAVLSAPPRAAAQAVELGVYGLMGTHVDENEVRARKASGLGLGASAQLRLRRLRVEGRLLRLEFDPEEAIDRGFDLTQVEAQVAFRFLRLVEAEFGAARRFVDPDLVAPDVGQLAVGVRSETTLLPGVVVWVRGSYLLLTRFSSGGEGALAFRVGLGSAVRVWQERLRITVAYEFERIDRRGGLVDNPNVLAVARAGVLVGF
jgi:hypothetical protein